MGQTVARYGWIYEVVTRSACGRKLVFWVGRALWHGYILYLSGFGDRKVVEKVTGLHLGLFSWVWETSCGMLDGRELAGLAAVMQ